MKKLILLISIALITLSSCKKDSLSCYTYVDCLGNDLQTVCNMKESDVQAYCAAHSTGGCTMTYRKQ